MKTKIISVIIAVTFILNCAAIFASPEADSGTYGLFEKEADVMIALGIIAKPAANAAADGSQVSYFDEAMTRGEFIGSVIRLIGMDPSSVEPNNAIFSDVPLTHRHANAIHIAYTAGIVDYASAGFNPDATITLSDATIFLVRALGYKKIALIKGDGFSGYGVVANELKLCNGIAKEKELSRAKAAKLLYNALDVDIGFSYRDGIGERQQIVQGRTVMTEYLHVSRGKGVLTQTSETSLTGTSAVSAGKGEVIINYKNYLVGECEAEKYLGYRVEFYYKSDKDKETLCWIGSFDTAVEMIRSEDISDYRGNVLSYFPNGDDSKEKSLTISSSVDALINGRAYSDYTNDDITFKNNDGYVVLIDNNLDDIYDVIFITECVNYVVDYINVEEDMIYSKFPVASIDLTEVRKTNIVDAAGKPMALKDIAKNNVITMQTSRDMYCSKIVVSDTIIEGTVVEVLGDNRVQLSDGVEYIVDRSYRQYIDKLCVGFGGVFLLDYNGRIAGVTEGADTDLHYGYLCRVAKEKGVGNKIKVKILDTTGDMNVYEIADKLTLDGDSVSALEFHNKFIAHDDVEDKGYTLQQVIKYKKRFNNKINYIDSATVGVNESDENLTVLSKVNEKWYNNATGAANTLNGAASFTSDVTAFVVPQVIEGNPRSVSNSFRDSDYFVLLDGKIITDTDYLSVDIDVVDADKAGIAEYMVFKEDWYEVPPKGGIVDTANTDVAYRMSYSYMVDRWTMTLGEDNEEIPVRCI